jgi:hypothetical protein
MEGFSFVTPITDLIRPNTGKEDDDDDALNIVFYTMPGSQSYFFLRILNNNFDSRHH